MRSVISEGIAAFRKKSEYKQNRQGWDSNPGSGSFIYKLNTTTIWVCPAESLARITRQPITNKNNKNIIYNCICT
jgi:hypothetical protein